MARAAWVAIAAPFFLCGQDAQNPLTCRVTAIAPIVRVEGLTELVGDVVLKCTDGTPTPPGVAVPAYDVKLTLNTGVTSRIINANTGLSEALLLVDEPGSAANPVPQTLCGAPGTFTTPQSTCQILGTSTGQAVYDGTATRPNVFQSWQQGNNSLVWLGVPLAAPITAGLTRVGTPN